jgi:hypothetical protein
MTLDRLPQELILHISSFGKPWLGLSRVNRRIHRVLKTNREDYESKFEEYFGCPYPQYAAHAPEHVYSRYSDEVCHKSEHIWISMFDWCTACTECSCAKDKDGQLILKTIRL